MTDRFFDFDINYFLKEAQFSLEEELTQWMVDEAIKFYQLQYNPLGLVDDTIREMNKNHPIHFEDFTKFYHRLAGVYRYKYGDNQLPLFFEGANYHEHYGMEWSEHYKNWISHFMQDSRFLRAVLELGVFHRNNRFSMARDRLISLLHEFFEMRFYPKKGITPWKPKRKNKMRVVR